jgi:hypothetical protein
VAAVCGRVEERAPAPVHDELRKREHSEKRKCGITRDESVAAVCGRVEERAFAPVHDELREKGTLGEKVAWCHKRRECGSNLRTDGRMCTCTGP